MYDYEKTKSPVFFFYVVVPLAAGALCAAFRGFR